MQLNEYWLCSWETVQLMYEKNPAKLYSSLLQKLENYSAISFHSFLPHKFNGTTTLEFMIFLKKADKNLAEFEVKIYKANKYDKYIANPKDCVKYYEDTEKYISFFFDSIEKACNFLFSIPSVHPEYKKRPIRETTCYGEITYQVNTIWD